MTKPILLLTINALDMFDKSNFL